MSEPPRRTVWGDPYDGSFTGFGSMMPYVIYREPPRVTELEKRVESLDGEVKRLTAPRDRTIAILTYVTIVSVALFLIVSAALLYLVTK